MEDISIVGIRLIVILALTGGLIAYIADVLGKRIGKAHIRFFGLRPRQNARLMTVMSGVVISVFSITVVALTSESARVALFGMDKLTKEIRNLEEERDRVVLALQDAKKNLEKQNAVIVDLDGKIKKANVNVDEAEKKVAELKDAKTKLTGEVTKLAGEVTKLTGEVTQLETNTKILKEGITAMREGELFYHAGEVIYAGIMRGNLNHKENLVQLNWLLRTANETVLRRLGIISQEIDPEKIPQAIVLQQETMDRALTNLDNAQNDKFFRIRTLTNVIVGEVSPCTIEIFDNRLIYRDGEPIYRQEYTMPKGNKNEDVMMPFLNQVNRESVANGVVPDPLSGNVGGLNAEIMLNVAGQLRKVGRHFVMEAVADGDIYTSGPVKLKFNVAKVVEE